MPTPIDNLKAQLIALDAIYENNYRSEAAISALEKTLQSFNITLNDWNQLLSYIESEGSIVKGMYQLYPTLLDATDYAKLCLDAAIRVAEIANEDPTDSKYSVGVHIYDTKTKQMYVVVEGLANNEFQLDDAFIDLGTSTSGTLTDSQFEIVKNKNAIIHIVDSGIDYFLRRIMYVSGPNFYRFECFTLISPTTDEIRFKTIHIDVEDRTHTYSGNIEITTQYKNSKVDALLSEKLNKVSTSGTNRLYGVDLSGNQTMYQVATANYPDSVAKRDSNGNIDIAYTPTADYHATSRRYVLEQIANAIAGVYKPQGTKTVAQINALTITSAYNGYVYNVSDAGELVNEDETTLKVNAGDNVVLIWNNGDYYWDSMSSFIDLTPYLTISAFNTAMENYDTKAEVNTKIATAKQELANKYDIYDFNISTSYPEGISAITTAQAEDLFAKKPQFIRLNISVSNVSRNRVLCSLITVTSGSLIYGIIDESAPTSSTPLKFFDGSILFSGLTGESPKINITAKVVVASADVNGDYIPVRNSAGQLLVPETPTQNGHATSKKYVDEQNQLVREVAEGKCQSFGVDYLDDIAELKYYIGHGEPVYDINGEDISEDIENGDYDNVYIYNSYFRSTDANIGLNTSSNWYIILRAKNRDEYLFLVKVRDLNLKSGDVFFVVNDNCPDRYYLSYKLYAFETKIDLNDYYTKIQSDARYVKQETLGNAYDNTQMYAVGDLVIYNNKLYKCITAITQPEDFDSAKWVEVSITEAFGILSKANTWSGENTFSSGIITGTIEMPATLTIKRSGNNIYQFQSGALLFFGNDIGSTARPAKDLYLSGNIKKGTNSVSVAQLSGVCGSYATNTTTQLEYSYINIIDISADTTFTLATAPANTYPEYKAKITNSHLTDDIDITFPSGTTIKTNDDSLVITNNVLTLPAGTTIEVNLQDGNMIAINWSAI